MLLVAASGRQELYVTAPAVVLVPVPALLPVLVV
jgi:hypothetical protein